MWKWTLRLALPCLFGVLAAALRVIWTSDAYYRPGVLDILGTIGIGVTMVGIVVWAICSWLGDGDPAKGPGVGVKG